MLPVLLLVFLSTALGDSYSCQNEAIALDADNPTFILNSTQMDSNQYCEWNFTMPPNFMAEITINISSMSIGDQVQLYSSWGTYYQSISVYPASYNNYTSEGFIHVMWPPAYFEMSIRTAKTSTLMMAVNIALKPLSVADKVSTLLSTSVNQQPNYVQFRDWKADSAILAQADNNGKLNIAVSSPGSGGAYFNIFVYEGAGDDLQFIGTLYALFSRMGVDSYISTTDTLTFYRAVDNGATATLLINDYENTKNLTYFHVDWSPYNRPDIDYQQKILLDATEGLAAVTVLNQADGSNAIYLQKIQYLVCIDWIRCPVFHNYTSPIKLLSGGMVRDYDTQGTLLGTYRDFEDFDDRNYPQFLPGMARTFVLEEGEAVLYYTSVAADTTNSEALDRRNGFVMSNNYPFKALDQNSQDFVLNSVDAKPFTFEYTIPDENPNEGSYLNFSITGGNPFIVPLHGIATPASFNLTAKGMTMSIVGGNEPSTGTFIPFKIYSTAELPAATTTAKGITTSQKPTTMPTASSTTGSSAATTSTATTTTSSPTTTSSQTPSTTTTETVTTTHSPATTSASGDQYNCQGEQMVFLNATDSAFIMNSTQFAANQYCKWKFEFPLGYAAEIQIEGWDIYDAVVRLFSRWGDNTQLITVPISSSTANDSLHVMWPPSYFELTIYTFSGSSMVLSMNITLKQMSNNVASDLSTAVNQQPNYIQLTDWTADTAIIAHSQSGGKVSVAMSSPIDPRYEYASIFVYNGSDDRRQLLGTLFSLLYTQSLFTPLPRLYTSPSDTLTFYRAMDSGVTATIIVNDYDNMKKLTDWSVDWSPYNRADENYQQAILIDASNGLAALTVLNEPDGSNAIYLQKVEYLYCTAVRCPVFSNYTSPIKVLAGGMIRDYDTQGTLLGIYRDFEDFDDRNYPQFLPGMARTFVLEEGSAVLYYTSVATDTTDSEAFDGRNGFVMSNNYPFKDVDQNSQDFVLNSVDAKPFTFEYTIPDKNPNEGSYLNFSINGTAGSAIVDLHNIATPATFNLTARTMTMTIFGGNESSTGTYIPYKIYSTAEPPAITTSSGSSTLAVTTTTGHPAATTGKSTTEQLTTTTGHSTTTEEHPTTTTGMSTTTTEPQMPTTGQSTTMTTGQDAMMSTTEQSTVTTTIPVTMTAEAVTTTTPKAASTYSGLTMVAAPLLILLL